MIHNHFDTKANHMDFSSVGNCRSKPDEGPDEEHAVAQKGKVFFISLPRKNLISIEMQYKYWETHLIACYHKARPEAVVQQVYTSITEASDILKMTETGPAGNLSDISAVTPHIRCSH